MALSPCETIDQRFMRSTAVQNLAIAPDFDAAHEWQIRWLANPIRNELWIGVINDRRYQYDR
jgi:hypothetical protein